MSYNCDTWKTKELTDLRIPLASLFMHPRTDWHPAIIRKNDGTVRLLVSEGSFIEGTLDQETLFVTSIECQGEGSGTAMEWIFEPALRKSTGRLVAACVWKAGDSINRITVDDGRVTWEDVEI